jgi:hypothetical protein
VPGWESPGGFRDSLFFNWRWPQKEKVSRVANDSPVHLVGAVAMKVRLGAAGRQPALEVPIRFKILGTGTCDWHRLLLGGRTLDTTTEED